MEDQDRIEGEGEDTEAHKLSVSKHDVAAAAEAAEDESDKPDVEGHKLDTKFSQKFDSH